MPSSNPSQLLRVYAAAIFLSAALLFAVQPMFTKMVLPKLGGTPSVWSVAMVFFQAVLLAGYAYAHALTSYLPGRRSMIVHLVVMGAMFEAAFRRFAGAFERRADDVYGPVSTS